MPVKRESLHPCTGRPAHATQLSSTDVGLCSGAPTSAETYLYAKTMIDCVTANADGEGRALLVGGGIANFTDVAATFKGIIQVGAGGPGLWKPCAAHTLHQTD